MKLTEEDRVYLREECHEDDEDIRQIEKVISKTTFKLDGKRIPLKEAIDLLGREEFLSGMDRSAFHWSAVRMTPDGREIHFDSRRFFRENILGESR